MNKIKHSMPLGDVAAKHDYYAAKQVDAMSGVWALFFALVMPVVGFVLGIVAIVRGRKVHRGVLAMGVLALLISIGVPVAAGLYGWYSFQQNDTPALTGDLTNLSSYESKTARLKGQYPAQFTLSEETINGVSYVSFSDKKTREIDRRYTVMVPNLTTFQTRDTEEIYQALQDETHAKRELTLSTIEQLTNTTIRSVAAVKKDNDYVYATFEEGKTSQEPLPTSTQLMSIAITKQQLGYIVTVYRYPLTDVLFESMIDKSDWARLVRSNQDTTPALMPEGYEP